MPSLWKTHTHNTPAATETTPYTYRGSKRMQTMTTPDDLTEERTLQHVPHGFSVRDDYLLEEPRRLPIRRRCQVLVCGAGPAGVGAALAAAREGADVVLLERWAMPGGMWTAGLVNPFFEWKNKGFIVADLISRLERAGAWKLWVKDYCFDPEIMKLTLEQMLAEAGVELLYYTVAVDAVRIGDCVKGVVLESKAGREVFLADVVIDATGDGDVAARAGCEFCFGSPVDGYVQPMTLMFEIDPIHGLRHRNSGELYDWLQAALEATGKAFELPFPRPQPRPARESASHGQVQADPRRPGRRLPVRRRRLRGQLRRRHPPRRLRRQRRLPFPRRQDAALRDPLPLPGPTRRRRAAVGGPLPQRRPLRPRLVSGNRQHDGHRSSRRFGWRLGSSG
ncbi:MAG: FAD-dependent oxidoreductase [Armatimonadetes bacterium]|nr:FAD-dependent oxidoreductase [Armatimonadota bacterium]